MAQPTLFLVTPPLEGARGGVAVSARRIAEHLRQVAQLWVFEATLDLPPTTYTVCDDGWVRVSLAGDRRRAHQFLSDLLLAQARRTSPTLLAGFYAGELAHPLMLTASLLKRPAALFARGNDIDLEVFGENGPRILAALGQAARVFCVTRELESKIRAWVPGARTLHIPNGVDPDVLPLQPPSPVRDRPVVGIFGDLKPKKGLELLLEQLDFDRFELQIVGDLRAETEKLLQGFLCLHPDRAIHHQPYLEDRQALLDAYRAVDLVCIPSLHEGMSNVMLEAMSCGRLCVCSRVGGAPEVITDGEDGFLFDLDGAAAPLAGRELARALERAAAGLRGGRAEAMRLKARRTIEERFSAARERAAYLAELPALMS